MVKKVGIAMCKETAEYKDAFAESIENNDGRRV